MSYITHAINEFKALGWIDEHGEWNDEMQEDICKHVLELLRVFHDEDHSGATAPYAIDLFTTLAKFEPLSPLTGEDWEWNEVCDERTNGVSVFQNKRCGHVFKQSDRFNGQPYDIDAVVFWEWYVNPETDEKTKIFYTSPESFRPIEFPYVPETVYVHRQSDTDETQFPSNFTEGSYTYK